MSASFRAAPSPGARSQPNRPPRQRQARSTDPVSPHSALLRGPASRKRSDTGSERPLAGEGTGTARNMSALSAARAQTHTKQNPARHAGEGGREPALKELPPRPSASNPHTARPFSPAAPRPCHAAAASASRPRADLSGPASHPGPGAGPRRRRPTAAPCPWQRGWEGGEASAEPPGQGAEGPREPPPPRRAGTTRGQAGHSAALAAGRGTGASRPPSRLYRDAGEPRRVPRAENSRTTRKEMRAPAGPRRVTERAGEEAAPGGDRSRRPRGWRRRRGRVPPLRAGDGAPPRPGVPPPPAARQPGGQRPSAWPAPRRGGLGWAEPAAPAGRFPFPFPGRPLPPAH